MIKIGDLTIGPNTMPSALLASGKYQAVSLTPIMELTSAPYYVDFHGGLFMARYIFINGRLACGMLEPCFSEIIQTTEAEWAYYTQMFKTQMGGNVIEETADVITLRCADMTLACQKLHSAERRHSHVRILFEFSIY